MAAAAAERCRVWPKIAAQGVKCGRAHRRGAGSSRHPAIFPVVFGELIHANIPQSSAISRTVSPPLLRMIFLTLAIISSFFDVDGRPELGSLSSEVLPSLNRRNQSNTCVRPIASSPYACCNNWYVSVAGFQILQQNLMQMRCSVLSHIVKIAMTKMHVLLPRPITAKWANAATCNLWHELLRHVRTCQDVLQTHPTQWTTTTIPIRILFEQTSYIRQLLIVVCIQYTSWWWPTNMPKTCRCWLTKWTKDKQSIRLVFITQISLLDCRRFSNIGKSIKWSGRSATVKGGVNSGF